MQWVCDHGIGLLLLSSDHARHRFTPEHYGIVLQDGRTLEFKRAVAREDLKKEDGASGFAMSICRDSFPVCFLVLLQILRPYSHAKSLLLEYPTTQLTTHLRSTLGSMVRLSPSA
jgi:hypothetical protein